MAKLQEILEKEKVRGSDSECRTVHLFQEGTFYRAYNWSAWLCTRYISQFKPTRRQMKNSEESFVFVGFPVDSLHKFVPEGEQYVQNEDKSVDFVIPQSLLPSVSDMAQPTSEYGNWKQCVPLTESKPKEKSGNVLSELLVAGSTDVKSILKKILVYPLEQKSLIDNTIFLTELKQQVATII